ncbi:phage tail length tape measure family protein [Mesorhizobium sp. M0965]|uniref:phage tail length tape measure family protein n=1 Tax=unclassified Mesorhizobium TaxID=325217 RepID=UPI00333A7672
MSLNLALVISGNAAGATAAAGATSAAVRTVGVEATRASAALTAANDQAAASSKRVTDMLTGQEAVQKRIQGIVAAYAGMRGPTDDATYRQRAADISAYGVALDRIRAKYDPLSAAQTRYRTAIEAINQAERTGAISGSLAIDARLRETVALNSQISALNGLAAAQKNAAQSMVNRVSIVPDRGSDIAAYGEELDRIRANYDPLFVAQTRYRTAIEAINQAERTGAISGSLAIDARLRETVALNSQISALNGLAAAQKNAAQSMVNRVSIVPDRGSDIAAYGDELDRLRARFNPLYAASKQYEAELTELNNAHKVGAFTSAKEYDLALAHLNDRYTMLGRQSTLTVTGLNSVTGAARLTSNQLLNLSRQGNDVITMWALGLPPMQIFASQAGQIYDALESGPKGLRGSLAAIRASLASTARSFIGFVGPVGLIAAGVGVAGAAFAAYSLLSREATKSLDGALKDHVDLIKKVGEGWKDTENAVRGVGRESQTVLSFQSMQAVNELRKSVDAGTGQNLQNQFGGSEAFTGIPGSGLPQDQFQIFDRYKIGGLEPVVNQFIKSAQTGYPDVVKFNDAVAALGQAPGASAELKKRVAEILGFTATLAEAQRAVQEYDRNIGPGGLIRSGSAFNQRDMKAYDEWKLADDAAHNQRIGGFQAQLQEMNARSPAEKQAAAEAAARAQINASESAAARADRIDIAGKLALASATKSLVDAQKERLRSLDQTVAVQQLEISLVGRTAAEAAGLRMAFQLEQAVREEAARNNVPADEAEIRRIREKAAEYGRLSAIQSARAAIFEQGQNIETQRAELALVGASTAAHDRVIAALTTEQQIRQLGIDLYGKEAEAMRANTSELSAMAEAKARANLARDLQFERDQLGRSPIEATVADRLKGAGLAVDLNSEAAAMIRMNELLKQQKQLWEDVRETGVDAIGGIVDSALGGFTDIDSVLKSAADDVLKQLAQLAIKNPLANAVYNKGLPTLDSIGGIGGFIGTLLGGPQPAGGQSVGAMDVQAGVVNINGALGVSGGTGTIFDSIKRFFSPANSNSADPSSGMRGSGAATSTLSDVAGSSLRMVGNFKSGVDARLMDILDSAAKRFGGYQVDAISGLRLGDPRFHGQGLATDVRLTDLLTGKKLGNYQDPSTFATYEKFAQTARQVQMEKYPELTDRFRWGGYFGGQRGKYGAMDEMHFDLGGGRLGMAGGSWRNGLNDNQRALFPGVESAGNKATAAITRLTESTGLAAKGLNSFGGGLGQLGNALSQFPAAPAGGGLSGFSSIWSMISGFFRSPAAWSAIQSGAGGLYDVGGATGGNDPRRVAGLVHEQEYVMDAPVVRALGVPFLDSLRRTAKSGRGYYEGGYAMPGAGSSGSPSMGGWSSQSAQPTRVERHYHDYAGVSVREEETEDGKGGRREDIIIEEKLTAAANRRGSSFNKTLAGRGARQPVKRR